MDVEDLSQMNQIEKEAKLILQETTIKYPPPKLVPPTFIPGDINDEAIIDMIGVLQTELEDTAAGFNQTDDIGGQDEYGKESELSNEEKEAKAKDTKSKDNPEPKSTPIDQGARPKTKDRKQPYTQHQDRKQQKKRGDKTDTKKVAPSRDKTDRDQGHEISVSDVTVRSVIQIQGKSSDISSIVPVNSNRMWIAMTKPRNRLTLINYRGKFIKKSVKVSEGIDDVKLYNSDLLITSGRKVIRMSSYGASTSLFSDLSPYDTLGLCIGHNHDVLVICVIYTSDIEVTESKIVRVSECGSIVQTIQYDNTGAPLFTDPWYITSLPSGDIMVTDQYKIIAVDREGGHLFTWAGEKEEAKENEQNAYSVTHDGHNNVFVTDHYDDRLYVMGREGRGVRCLLDSTQGLSGPEAVAVNHDGQLLVGCEDGKIFVIDY